MPVSEASRARSAAHKKFPILRLAEILDLRFSHEARHGNFYYYAPWRDENTASLVLCQPKNCWIDFGDGPPAPGQKRAPGDVPALLMRAYGLTLPGARELLENLAATVPLEVTPPVKIKMPAAHGPADEDYFQDVELSELGHPVLVGYLERRGIDLALIRRNPNLMRNLQQVTYRSSPNQPKPYFALAWRTNAGYELRNAKFQACMGRKAVTWLPGAEPNVMVFEGFFDYLSALTFHRRSSFRCNVLILNGSTSDVLEMALPYLKTAERVFWHGDNDAAGEKALQYFIGQLPANRITPYNEQYRGFKDFNDFLTQTPPRKPLPANRAEPSELSKTAKWWLWVVFDKLDPELTRKRGRPMHKARSFYAWNNEKSGWDWLMNLRHDVQGRILSYKLCQRTEGRKYIVLAEEGGVTPATLAKLMQVQVSYPGAA